MTGRISANNKPLSFDELMAKDLPPIRWLVDGLVPEDGITVLAGMSGSYKTWLMMDMAISIATGNDFLDIFSTRQTGILIIDEENGERLYSERFKLLTDQKDLTVYLVSMSGFVVNAIGVKNTVEFCKEKGIRLVMIDSMTRVHVGDENTSKDVAKFFALLRGFTKEGISVLVIHHNRKPGQGGYDASSDMRGSSDIRAAVDIQLAIRRIGESSTIEVRQPKCRYGVESNAFRLGFHEDEESGKLKFVYLGMVNEKNTDETNNLKRAKVREGIVRFVGEHPGVNKGTAAAEVARKTGVGITKIKTEISDMVERGILLVTTGSHNASLLSLSGESEAVKGDS